MHSTGDLSDEEFAQAKRTLLAEPSQVSPVPDMAQPGANSLGEAANRYVNGQIALGVAVIVVFLMFVFMVIVPSLPQHEPVSSSSGPVLVPGTGPGNR